MTPGGLEGETSTRLHVRHQVAGNKGPGWEGNVGLVLWRENHWGGNRWVSERM